MEQLRWSGIISVIGEACIYFYFNNMKEDLKLKCEKQLRGLY